MKQIKIADTTLCMGTFSFKEKIEIARQLERLCVDVIELSEIENVKTDILLVKTISSFVKNSTISVAASSPESVENAANALATAKNARIRIELPISPVGMEYTCHKKAPKMLEWISKTVALAKEKCDEVEFCALDATRADNGYLKEAMNAAIFAGATHITICDSADEMMPDDFAAYIKQNIEGVVIPVYVSCSNKNSLATASAALSVKAGAQGVKTSVGGEITALDAFAGIARNCGLFEAKIKQTELNRIVKQIAWIKGSGENSKAVLSVQNSDQMGIHLDSKDTVEDVIAAINKLGYDLSSEDELRVYEEFKRAAEKKSIGAKELDAIVASAALQVPATYKLESYVINNGNIISATAQITLSKNGESKKGFSLGDGPIDAAFLAIDQIIGYHYELDDFQIQSITEGKEAMGSALVKLRANGKVYSGNGISTDIIGAAIRAYLNAVNKIIYEEA